jgi:hypothetical protein
VTAGEGAPVPSVEDFVACARADPVNAALLDRLPALGLPQGYLTAGCLFQAWWNLRSGRAPGEGVKDYDIFYFDDRDLSWAAEDAVIRRVRAALAHLPAEIEVKNQARVHLWYPARFGRAYPQLRSAREGIDRYLVACTCIGISLEDGSLHAPDGLGDMHRGILRPNPLTPAKGLFAAKAASYRARWPWLMVAGMSGVP